MIHEIQHTAQQHNNNSSVSEGYGMSQNPQNEWGQATFDSKRNTTVQSTIIPPINTSYFIDRLQEALMCRPPQEAGVASLGGGPSEAGNPPNIPWVASWRVKHGICGTCRTRKIIIINKQITKYKSNPNTAPSSLANKYKQIKSNPMRAFLIK